MPSPFPGMDPYIELPEVWSDFHNDLTAEIRAGLNTMIRPRYVARLIPYTTYETVTIDRDTHNILPDVGIWEQQEQKHTAKEAGVLYNPTQVTSEVEIEFPIEIFSVEIQRKGTLELVTSIEILSPVNKKRGHPAYDHYLKKRRDLLYANVHLVEIDLLRGGTRPSLLKPVPPAPYYIMLSRREQRPQVIVYPLQFQDRLPVLPVPLLKPDPDVTLDLNAAVGSVYERGGYADLIDYREPPPPPLSDEEMIWLDARLHEQAVRQN
jgi:hypothetical protein